MPKLSGIFEQFRRLDQIPIADIAQWLNHRVEQHSLENFIGNRIIYPQTLPTTKMELDIDLAIFREAVRRQPEVFYDRNPNKIIIPAEYEFRFGSMEALVTALSESLKLPKITTVYLKSLVGNTLLGSIYQPNINTSESNTTISVNNQIMGLKNGLIHIMPFRDKHLILKIGNITEISASGGSLGLIIDLSRVLKIGPY